MATHAVSVTTTSVLLLCTGVFTKPLGLPCKHKIQESFRHPDHPLRRDDLRTHRWLNPLENEQPVEPLVRIQPPVRTRRRGRPRNPRREPSAFEIAAARVRNEANARAGAVGNRGGNVVAGVYQGLGVEMLIERETVVILHAKINPVELVYVADYHLQVCFQMGLSGR